MATNTIEFAGVTLPCTVERFPEIKKPARKFRQYNIPGRNGDVFFQDDAWENVIQSYEVYAGGNGSTMAQTKWGDLAKLLYLKGYQELYDTYDPAHFRKAIFNGPIDVENSWNTHGRATLEFNCRPERYLVDGMTSYSFEALTAGYGVKRYELSELSNFLRTGVSWPAGTEAVYLFVLRAVWGNDFYIWNYADVYGDGWLRYVNIHSSDPTTALSATTVSTKYAYRGYATETHVSDTNILIPVQYFDGAPMLAVSDPNDPDTPIEYGSPDAPINNLYMPCYPTLVLHMEQTYSGEIMAAHINGYGIYIEYDQDSSYYFIDTENYTIEKSDALNGNRILANNARMDAGIRMDSGKNIIYTSEEYEIESLVPNFWEL